MTSNPISIRDVGRRLLIAVAVLSLGWAFAVVAIGGVAIDVGPLRVSSHNARNPFLLTIVAGVAASVLYRKGDRRQQWDADRAWLSELAWRAVPLVLRRRVTPGVFAAVTAAMVVLVGIVAGADVVGGADSYGYVSQAHLWARGSLPVPQPLLNDWPADVPQEALVPLGYRLNPDRSGLVPLYAPGLPMMMAVFERAAGADAVFLVVPVLSGLLIWTTYALGRALIGASGASVAAVFLATSPAFLFQLIHAPMSDIAAAAWWNTAFLLLLHHSRLAALASGLATAAAILTRPNLVPLAAVLGGVLLTALGSRERRWLAVQRLLWFAAPAVAACLLVAVINAAWYGSPIASGYGSLAGTFFRWDYVGTNLANYARWLLESQGPLSLLSLIGLVAIWHTATVRRDRAIVMFSLCFAVVAYACYAFYLPVGTWWSLRFLLPAFPVFFMLMAAGAAAVVDRLPHGFRHVGLAVIVAAATVHVTGFGRTNQVFDIAEDVRYQSVARYLNDHTPPRSAFLTMLHSGSVRYYTDRLTIRHDWIPPERFDATVAHLRQRGFVPFLLLDEAEEAEFRRRFADTPMVKSLPAPDVQLARVSLYRLSDR